jgi:hypothetical protein
MYRRALVLSACATFAGCGPGKGGSEEDSGKDKAPQDIQLSTELMQFETIAVEERVQKGLTINNFGGTALLLTDMSVSQPFSTDFSEDFSVDPGGQVTFYVYYWPLDLGDYEEILTVASDDPDEPSSTVTLRGGTISDQDKDGYPRGDEPGQDCDDTDPDIHPGAEEHWYNGVDDNCLCDNPRCTDWDQDADGFDEDDHNPNPATFGGDCNDVNAAFHPDAKDAWYDGYDHDCNGGNDYDQDGDGYSSHEHY